MRRMFGPLGNFGSKLKRAYVEQEKQLNLFLDIENGYGERNKHDIYIDLEREKNEQVSFCFKNTFALKKMHWIYMKHNTCGFPTLLLS